MVILTVEYNNDIYSLKVVNSYFIDSAVHWATILLKKLWITYTAWKVVYECTVWSFLHILYIVYKETGKHI